MGRGGAWFAVDVDDARPMGSGFVKLSYVGSVVYLDVARLFFGEYDFECPVCVRVCGRSNVLFVVGRRALERPSWSLGRCRCLASDDCGGS